MRGMLRAVGAVVVAVLVGAVILLGRAGEPPSIAETGVDGLRIPLAAPAPSDFVDDPDGNAWFPLDPDGEHRTIDGVVTVRHDWVEHDGPETIRHIDFYAEDLSGNVWWFARQGVFTAGVDGARPGLAMPAQPRRGDGFRRALADGVEDDIATVVLRRAATVILYVSSALDPSLDRREFYRRNTGLQCVRPAVWNDAC